MATMTFPGISTLTDALALDVPPGPQVAEPLPADRPVRWGILSTGKIARGFARNLALLPDAELAAVAAREPAAARRFAADFDVARAHDSYQDLVADEDVDVVYVATPHALHKEHALLALEAGKPVLCEKPLTLHAADAEELVATAREKRLFFMEGMWMRCNPVLRRVKQLVDAGALGTVRQVRADLGFVVDRPATDRLLAPELGGGALLDMGVYPLTLATWLLGEPDRFEAVADLAPTGIDLDVAVSLAWASGATAAVTASMTSWSPRTATIATDRGRVDLAEGFHHPRSATWVSEGVREEITGEVIGTGLANEAAEVIRCLRRGEIESPLVPHADTVATMRLMDRIRERIGVRYPGDPNL